ncbi:hypothetical protein OG533_28950 [Streptomyces sp. NBC_01186]|nr:hypothetical protein OG533_28950 [Streptomyces sp. NBC_01186]
MPRARRASADGKEITGRAGKLLDLVGTADAGRRADGVQRGVRQ